MASSQRPEERQISEQLLKVGKENLGICRQGSIALIPGTILEEIINNLFLIPSGIIN